MAPNLGQGACVAIVNAVVLARAVSETNDVPTALHRWEASERPYIDRTQRMSYLYGAVGTRWPKRFLGLRSKVLPLLARTDLFQHSLRVAVDHKPGI
jgi:2-polyprenyl-6-methoxyphenol hydroxylase-like FAD-dependent oxidoreductase